MCIRVTRMGQAATTLQGGCWRGGHAGVAALPGRRVGGEGQAGPATVTDKLTAWSPSAVEGSAACRRRAAQPRPPRQAGQAGGRGLPPPHPQPHQGKGSPPAAGTLGQCRIVPPPVPAQPPTQHSTAQPQHSTAQHSHLTAAFSPPCAALYCHVLPCTAGAELCRGAGGAGAQGAPAWHAPALPGASWQRA